MWNSILEALAVKFIWDKLFSKKEQPSLKEKNFSLDFKLSYHSLQGATTKLEMDVGIKRNVTHSKEKGAGKDDPEDGDGIREVAKQDEGSGIREVAEQDEGGGIRKVAEQDEGQAQFDLDAAIPSGSSGGGLFDKKGNFIGILTGTYNNEYTKKIGFAIPADLALEF